MPPDRPELSRAESPELDTSAYAQAQVTAERKGLTLDTRPILAHVRQLQVQADRLFGEQVQTQALSHTRRVALLAVTTIALWLSALIVLLERV